MLFENLNIIEPIQKALKTEGYKEATPIQAEAIPSLLKGTDLLGCAQTGTGKTAAFAIPILQGIESEKRGGKGKRQIKSLILAPTRELAIQIGKSFEAYSKYMDIKTLTIFGGVSQHPQTKALIRGVDVLVATPGRLLDLINQRYVSLNHTKYFVLDEADMMLDMGMIHDVRRIIKYVPAVRQTMFFSATMPSEIEKLANSILKNPLKVEITPESTTVDTIEQSVYRVDKRDKTNLLIHLLKNNDMESALVFSRTKHGANKIVTLLEKAGFKADAIHGNKSQNARQLALKNFKERKTRILVATDIAARGIDVSQLSHVINYNLPEVSETYVHRIGRTGRAGRGGIAISFCDNEERKLLVDIQKLISKSIAVVHDQPYAMTDKEFNVPAAPKQNSSQFKQRASKFKQKSSDNWNNKNNKNSKKPYSSKKKSGKRPAVK
jgi:ATP-dependent RNA helicase RhlE